MFDLEPIETSSAGVFFSFSFALPPTQRFKQQPKRSTYFSSASSLFHLRGELALRPVPLSLSFGGVTYQHLSKISHLHNIVIGDALFKKSYELKFSKLVW